MAVLVENERVLFVPIHASSLTAMLDLAQALKQQGLQSHFLLSTSYLQAQRERVLKLGFAVKFSQEVYEKKRPSKLSVWPLKFIQDFWPIRQGLLKKEERRIKNWPRTESRLLQDLAQEKYASVLFLGDRHLGIEPFILNWAHQQKIKAVVAPLMIKDDGHGALAIRKNVYFDVTESALFQQKFPGQIYYDQESKRAFSFYTPFMSEVLDRTGLLSQRPWVIGGSGKVLVCVDGEKEKRRCLENGLSLEQIVVTGQAVHDQLYRLQAAKKEKSSSPQHLLLSLPQYAEQGTLSWERHWEEMKFLFETLQGAPFKTLVSLHPKMNADLYLPLIRDYGFQWAQGAIHQHLPQADLFLAINSSTHLWASLCGVPAILMNFFDLDDRPFQEMEGVVIIHHHRELSPLLQRLLQDQDYYQKLQAAQAENVQEISPFDGKCLERIRRVLTNHLQSEHL